MLSLLLLMLLLLCPVAERVTTCAAAWQCVMTLRFAGGDEGGKKEKREVRTISTVDRGNDEMGNAI